MRLWYQYYWWDNPTPSSNSVSLESERFVFKMNLTHSVSDTQIGKTKYIMLFCYLPPMLSEMMTIYAGE